MAARDEQHGHKFLAGLKQRAMLRALFPQDVFINAQHSIRAPVTLHSCHYHGKVNTLINSGTTDNFISPSLTKKYRIDTHTLKQPLTIQNVDRTTNRNGSTKEMVTLHIKYDGETTLHPFYVIDLGSDSMLLEMPFLAATNPDIDWGQGIFGGEITAVTTDAKIRGGVINTIDQRHTPTPPPQGREVLKAKELPPGSNHYTCLLDKFLGMNPENFAFIRCTTKSTAIAAEAADKTKHTWQEQVPQEYHKYGKVFSERASQRMLESRPWDHAIDLLPNVPHMLNCKTYPLNPEQQKLLDNFL